MKTEEIKGKLYDKIGRILEKDINDELSLRELTALLKVVNGKAPPSKRKNIHLVTDPDTPATPGKEDE